jgi:hypothetical protein
MAYYPEVKGAVNPPDSAGEREFSCNQPFPGIVLTGKPVEIWSFEPDGIKGVYEWILTGKVEEIGSV